MNAEDKEPTETQIAEVENAFLTLYMGDIFRALRIDSTDITPETVIPEGAACIAATLSACCLIELAGRFKGGGKDAKAFETFAKYMQEKSGHGYRGNDLYKALRSGLVHSGTTNNEQKTLRYALSATPKNLPNDSAIVREATGSAGNFDRDNELQIQTFVADLKIALECYFAELREINSPLKRPFSKAYNEIGFLKTFATSHCATISIQP